MLRRNFTPLQPAAAVPVLICLACFLEAAVAATQGGPGVSFHRPQRLQQGECSAAQPCSDPADCCSKWGFCGITADHCGDGCVNGPCTNSSSATNGTSGGVTAVSPSPLPDGQCTAAQPCPNTSHCCSSAGFCGATDAYCLLPDCQAGPCRSKPTAPPSPGPQQGECGADLSCENPSHCCSKWGFCGVGDEYCGTGCQGGPCGSGAKGNKHGHTTGLIVGVTLGITLPLLAGLILGFWWWRSRRMPPRGTGSMDLLPLGPATSHMRPLGQPSFYKATGNPAFGPAPNGRTVAGLMAGDVFLKATADNYQWTDYLPGDTTVYVEAGVNDTQLDSWASIVPDAPAACLSKSELQEHIQLLSGGLLGKGATAYVFACRWRQRFGEHALLAAKVLMDGYHAEPYVLEAFAYEAGVLARVRHPNIVRLYGYCLEPPCVCLILELLPGSLKSVLYKTPPTAFQALAATRSKAWGGSSCHDTGGSTRHAGGSTRHTGGSTRHTGGSTSHSATYMPLPEPGPPTATGFGTNCTWSTTGGGTTCTTTSSTTRSYDAAAVLSVITPSSGRTTAPAPAFSMRGALSVARSSNATSAPVPALSMREVLRISRDVAAGLAHLHDQPVVLAASNSTPLRPRQGLEAILEQPPLMPAAPEEEGAAAPATARVVHRDLKPANVLLGSNGTAKISDFGLARQTYSTTLHTGSVGAGTLPYMAPELLQLVHTNQQASMQTKATSRVDLYSMAMIMWELIARQQPWYGRSENEILAAVIMGLRPHIPGVEQATPSLPEGVAAASAAPSQPPRPPQQAGAGDNSSSGATNTISSAYNSSSNADTEQLDLSQVPASFSVVPQFTTIIMQCWDQQPLQRPTAGQVYQQLHALCSRYTGESDAPDAGK